MAKIYEFPNVEQLNNKELESTLRDTLKSKGFSEVSLNQVASLIMPLITEAKETIGSGLKVEHTSKISNEEFVELQNLLSSEFQQYQKSISNFILKIIVSLALSLAQNAENNS